MEIETSGLERAWQKSKWMVKGLIVGFIALLLMIPMAYVKDLVREREERQKQVVSEISQKWAGQQNVIGPLIAVPFRVNDTLNKKVEMHTAYFLPDKLDIKAVVNPREKHRGIFKVMLYDAKISISGTFNELALEKLKISAQDVDWSKLYVMMSIADNKGLNKPVSFKVKDSVIELSQQTELGKDFLTANLQVDGPEDFKNINFTADVDLNGSRQLFFTPTGKTTTVNVNSTWRDPSFTGAILPQQSEIGKQGFNASWSSMSHTRSFPQQWYDDTYNMQHKFLSSPDDVIPASYLSSSSFGVDLFIPVNGYQKTWRTIKYAMLCILLTFAAFFLVETNSKSSAHPFQYGLIGLALILFYSLLLSFSEYTGFNIAYAIATVATVGLITWFVKQILPSGRSTTIISVVLILIYSYVFSLLNLQDYSLMLGSIGLFLTLAVIMYFSKKLHW